MNTPLIPITEKNGMTAVSGRDLHAFLEVKTPYKDWFPRQVEYGFVEDQDFSSVLSESTGGRPSVNHAMTLDMAKEVAMIQRTEKGKQARQYFIEVEKRKSVAPTGQNLLALAVIEAQKVIDAKDQHIAVLAPKASAWDSIVSSAGSWSYNDAAKVLCESGEIQIGEKRLVNRLVAWGYLYRDHKRRPHVYQRFLEKGLFVAKARTYEDKITGQLLESSAPQVRITGKGLDLIRERLLEFKLEVAA